MTDLAKLVSEYQGTDEFEVEFIKRTTGLTRVMKCKKGVTEFLKGGVPPYSFREKNLVCVYDVENKGYRTIPLENLQRVKIDNKEYIREQE
jgi:hypothetical protein